MNGLESEKSNWQALVTQRMAASSIPLPASGGSRERESSWWKRTVTVPRLSWSAGLAAVLMLVAWWAVRLLLTPDVNGLLASAYSEQRMMELRIPGAAYAPIRQERNAARSTLDQPQALLEATP